jgi:hypothetical protein
MNKSSERPPILAFLLAFIGLVAAALFLATLSPTPEPRGDDVSVFDGRGNQPDTKGTGSAPSPPR